MLISSLLQPVCGVPGAVGCSRNTPHTPLASCRAPQQPPHASVAPATALQQSCCSSSGSSSNSGRSPTASPLVCRAEPEPVSGYTPADFISFSSDDNKQCHHNAETVVDAPLDLAYSLWSDWTKQLEFLDLVGQIGLDSGNPHMALYQCFYRFRKLPLMEIVFLLEREEFSGVAHRGFTFKSVYGMPIKGQVQLGEQSDGQTRVRLYFTHPVPNLLVQLQIGPFGVETDLMRILQENLATYKALVEAAVPADWQQQKQEVAAKVLAMAQEQMAAQEQQWEQRQQEQEQEQSEGEQQQQQVEQEQQPAASQQQQQPQDVVGQEQQQQQQAPKRPRGRSTASKASSTAAAAAAAPTGQRGRKTTRGRTASNAAAAAGTAAGADDSSSSATTGRRRTTKASSSKAADTDPSSSSGNGTGAAAPPAAPSSSSGKAAGRRSSTRSKRASTAAKEGGGTGGM